MSAPGAPPALLDGIGQIFVRATNLPRAIAFYRDGLGLPFLFEAPGMAFFQCGDVRLLLGPPESAEYDHPSSILYFRTGDLPEAHRALTVRGVAFRSEPHLVHRSGDQELWMAFFKDSEENTMALMESRKVS